MLPVRFRQIHLMSNLPVLLHITTVILISYGIVRIMNREHKLIFIMLFPVRISRTPFLWAITDR